MVNLTLVDALDALPIPVDLQLVAAIGVQDCVNHSPVVERDFGRGGVGVNGLSPIRDLADCSRNAGIVDQLEGIAALGANCPIS